MDNMNYRDGYTYLFNTITKATRLISSSRIISNEIQDGLDLLIQGQQQTEEMYISSGQKKQLV